uniref:Granulins domain-containing protein n=2 Tax=Clytia hemisphaerica TaxID=252671 RepID=A0A7M5V9F9_9CNID
IKASTKKIAIKLKDVVCPDGQSECPSGNTCCKLSSGEYGCCPLPKATCCSDGVHCCPNGYSCDGGVCSKATEEVKPSLLKTTKSSPQFHHHHLANVQKFDKSDIVCPDGQSECPSGYTCCPLDGGYYGCCPYDHAVCCSDEQHCCPLNSVCSPDCTECLDNNNRRFPSQTKTPSKQVEQPRDKYVVVF